MDLVSIIQSIKGESSGICYSIIFLNLSKKKTNVLLIGLNALIGKFNPQLNFTTRFDLNLKIHISGIRNVNGTENVRPLEPSAHANSQKLHKIS